MRDVIYGLTLGITCNSLMQFKTSFSHRQTSHLSTKRTRVYKRCLTVPSCSGGWPIFKCANSCQEQKKVSLDQTRKHWTVSDKFHNPGIDKSKLFSFGWNKNCRNT